MLPMAKKSMTAKASPSTASYQNHSWSLASTEVITYSSAMAICTGRAHSPTGMQSVMLGAGTRRMVQYAKSVVVSGLLSSRWTAPSLVERTVAYNFFFFFFGEAENGCSQRRPSNQNNPPPLFHPPLDPSKPPRSRRSSTQSLPHATYHRPLSFLPTFSPQPTSPSPSSPNPTTPPYPTSSGPPPRLPPASSAPAAAGYHSIPLQDPRDDAPSAFAPVWCGDDAGERRWTKTIGVVQSEEAPKMQGGGRESGFSIQGLGGVLRVESRGRGGGMVRSGLGMGNGVEGLRGSISI